MQGVAQVVNDFCNGLFYEHLFGDVANHRDQEFFFAKVVHAYFRPEDASVFTTQVNHSARETRTHGFLYVLIDLLR